MIKHRNILKLIEVYDEPERINLVTELCEGKNLVDLINTTKITRDEQFIR